MTGTHVFVVDDHLSRLIAFAFTTIKANRTLKANGLVWTYLNPSLISKPSLIRLL